MSGWADTIPDWLQQQIAFESTTAILIEFMGKDLPEEATDAQVCAALYCSGLSAPLTHNASEIYLYLATGLLKGRGKHVPTEICVEAINEDQKRELLEYRRILYRALRKQPDPLRDVLKMLASPKKNPIESVSTGQQTLW